MDYTNKFCVKSELLSWCKLCFKKSDLIGGDNFVSIIDQKEVKSFLYHPTMETVQSLIKIEDESKKGVFRVSDLYDIGVFDGDCIFLPQVRENKDLRNTWYKYQIVDVNTTKRQDGITPLTLACYFGRPQLVMLLLSVLNHPSEVITVDGSSPIIETIAGVESDVEERLQCLQHLVKHGATALTQHKDGHNALTLSCFRGKEEFLKLLDASFSMLLDWNHQTSLGHTPLMFAVYSGNLDVIKFLINSKDVDVMKENHNLLTAFDISLLLDSSPAIKGLLAIHMHYSNKLKSYIQRRIDILYNAMYSSNKELSKVQLETLFVSCLLSVAYLGRFRQVRNVILEPGVIDFITTYSIWENVSPQIKSEFCIILAAFLIYDCDSKGMSKLIATNWATTQFQNESDNLDTSDEYSIDRFMAIVSFFLFAEDGSKWVIDNFMKYPQMGIMLAGFDLANDTFSSGFFKEISKILTEFNIEEGFEYHPRYEKSKAQKLLNSTSGLKKRISALISSRRSIVRHLQEHKEELEKQLQNQKHHKHQKQVAKKKIEIGFISKCSKGDGCLEACTTKPEVQTDIKINAKGDNDEKDKKETVQINQPVKPLPLFEPDPFEQLSKKQLRKLKKENKKRHLQNLKMKDFCQQENEKGHDITYCRSSMHQISNEEPGSVNTSSQTNEVESIAIAPNSEISPCEDSVNKANNNCNYKDAPGTNSEISQVITYKEQKRLNKKAAHGKKKQNQLIACYPIGHPLSVKRSQRSSMVVQTIVPEVSSKEECNKQNNDENRNLKIVATYKAPEPEITQKIYNLQNEEFIANSSPQNFHKSIPSQAEQCPETVYITNNESDTTTLNVPEFYISSPYLKNRNRYVGTESQLKTDIASESKERAHVYQQGNDGSGQNINETTINTLSSQKEENLSHLSDSDLETAKRIPPVYNAGSVWDFDIKTNKTYAQAIEPNILKQNNTQSNLIIHDKLQTGIFDYSVVLEKTIKPQTGEGKIEKESFNEVKYKSEAARVERDYSEKLSSLPQPSNVAMQQYIYGNYNSGSMMPETQRQQMPLVFSGPYNQCFRQPAFDVPNYQDPAIVSMAKPASYSNYQNISTTIHAESDKHSDGNSQLHFPSFAHEPISQMIRAYFPTDQKVTILENNQTNHGNILPSNEMQVHSKNTTDPESGYMSPPIAHDERNVKFTAQPMFVKNWQKRSVRWNPILSKLVHSSPEKITRAGSLNFLNHEDSFISKGSCGTVVRVGIRDDGSEVAVKCMVKVYTKLISNELQSLRELQHPNIIHYKDYVEDDNFAYVALELCEYTLDEYIDILKSNGTLAKHTRRLSMQLITGLKALHDAKVLHMDLKPRNVLVDVKGNLRLADFGLSHRLNEEQNTFYHTSVHGTKCWRAPETISVPFGSGENRGRYKPSTDIYVSAMILYFIVTGGKHPFGEDTARCEMNILNGLPPNIRILQDEVFVDLFLLMMDPDMNRRISTVECLAHPFFWDDHRRFEFLVNVGHDHDLAGRISNELIKVIESLLMMKTSTGKWSSNIDQNFMKYMGWQSLQLNSVLDILTIVIPEVDERYQHTPKHLLGIVGKEPDVYILSCFPGLFMAVYEAVCSVGWKRRPGLREFFNMKQSPYVQ